MACSNFACLLALVCPDVAVKWCSCLDKSKVSGDWIYCVFNLDTVPGVGNDPGDCFLVVAAHA
jgi:hypothetical protein